MKKWGCVVFMMRKREASSRDHVVRNARVRVGLVCRERMLFPKPPRHAFMHMHCTCSTRSAIWRACYRLWVALWQRARSGRAAPALASSSCFYCRSSLWLWYARRQRRQREHHDQGARHFLSLLQLLLLRTLQYGHLFFLGKLAGQAS